MNVTLQGVSYEYEVVGSGGTTSTSSWFYGKHGNVAFFRSFLE